MEGDHLVINNQFHDSLGELSDLSESSEDSDTIFLPSRTFSGTSIFKRRKSSIEGERLEFQRQLSLRPTSPQNIRKRFVEDYKDKEFPSIKQDEILEKISRGKIEIIQKSEKTEKLEKKKEVKNYESPKLRGYHSDTAIDHARKKTIKM